MHKLNQYSHNLAGKEIVYDNGNWSCQGKWHREIYKVNSDSSVQHIRTEKYWTNVRGEDEKANGKSFVPDCDGEAIYIAGIRCKLPYDSSFELLPEHTCQEPLFHDYTYSVDGKCYKERYGFCSIAEAKSKWQEFTSSFPQYAFKLLSIERSTI
jgi:hypothetical protein